MRNRKTYFLDLQTLLLYLRDQSCELTTELTVARKIARGSIVLKEGEIVHCLLSFQKGKQIVGEQAYRQLETCTQWQVELEQPEEQKKAPPTTRFLPQPAPPALLPAPPAPAHNPWYSFPLRQKRPLDPVFLQSLPMKERSILRSVFIMIDGKRSSEEIKAQLHLSSREIDDALTRLRALDVIE